MTHFLTSFKSSSALGLLGAAVTLALASAQSVQASAVIFTETGLATGSLNGVAFAGKPLTISILTDTGNVTDLTPTLHINIGTATLSIEGFSPVTLIGTFAAFSQPDGSSPLTLGAVGIGTLNGGGSAVMFNGNTSPAYLLAAPASFSGAGQIIGGTYASTGGDFVLAASSPGSYTGTFTAELVPSAVPEPGTWMSGLALLSMTGLVRRRKVTK